MAKPSFTVTKINGGRTLHIEAPGCIINVAADLHDSEGREVVNISIRCDDYAGEPAWHPIDVNSDATGVGMRIIRDEIIKD